MAKMYVYCHNDGSCSVWGDTELVEGDGRPIKIGDGDHFKVVDILTIEETGWDRDRILAILNSLDHLDLSDDPNGSGTVLSRCFSEVFRAGMEYQKTLNQTD